MDYKFLEELGYRLLYDDEIKLSFVKISDKFIYRLLFLKNEKKIKHDSFLNEMEISDLGEAYIDLKLYKAIGKVIEMLKWESEASV